MNYFAIQLIPNQATFPQDMTDAERVIMQSHVAYWTNLMEQGKVVVFGPVLNPAGAYGLGIVRAESMEEIDELIAHDPANVINRYEYHQMMAVVPVP